MYVLLVASNNMKVNIPIFVFKQCHWNQHSNERSKLYILVKPTRFQSRFPGLKCLTGGLETFDQIINEIWRMLKKNSTYGLRWGEKYGFQFLEIKVPAKNNLLILWQSWWKHHIIPCAILDH